VAAYNVKSIVVYMPCVVQDDTQSHPALLLSSKTNQALPRQDGTSGSGVTVQLDFNLSTVYSGTVGCKPKPSKLSPVPNERETGGSQRRSGSFGGKNNLSPLHTVQSVVQSLYQLRYPLRKLLFKHLCCSLYVYVKAPNMVTVHFELLRRYMHC